MSNAVTLEGTGWCKGNQEDATIVSWTKSGNPRIKVTLKNRASMIRAELYDEAETKIHMARKRADGFFHVSIQIGFQPDTYRFSVE